MNSNRALNRSNPDIQDRIDNGFHSGRNQDTQPDVTQSDDQSELLVSLRAEYPPVPVSRVKLLTAQAIYYGSAMTSLSLPQLGDRLYRYNQAPFTPDLKERFATTWSVLQYVFKTAQNYCSDAADPWYLEKITPEWFLWRTMWASSTPARFKLYISPRLEDFPNVFQIAMEILPKHRCRKLRMAIQGVGLIRSDKCVAYFDRMDALKEAAREIEKKTLGLDAQGVPFTGPLDLTGMCSWSVESDEPFDLSMQPELPPSWRRRVAYRVAEAIRTSIQYCPTRILQGVLRSMANHGVDTEHWTPLERLDGENLDRVARVEP